MKTYPELILNQPIESLALSQEFKGIAEINGMHTLAEVLKLYTRDLQRLPGFTIPLIHEYVSFIEKQGLGHYIDPIK